MVDLLCGLLSPNKGEILIDNQKTFKKLNEFSKLYTSIHFSFDETLFYNITLDLNKSIKKNKKFEKILRLCELNTFHKINLSRNKNYKLGDKGIKISGVKTKSRSC